MEQWNFLEMSETMNTDKDQERTLWEQEDSEVEQEQETSQEPEIASDSDSKKNNIEDIINLNKKRLS